LNGLVECQWEYDVEPARGSVVAYTVEPVAEFGVELVVEPESAAKYVAKLVAEPVVERSAERATDYMGFSHSCFSSLVWRPALTVLSSWRPALTVLSSML